MTIATENLHKHEAGEPLELIFARSMCNHFHILASFAFCTFFVCLISLHSFCSLYNYLKCFFLILFSHLAFFRQQMKNFITSGNLFLNVTVNALSDVENSTEHSVMCYFSVHSLGEIPDAAFIHAARKRRQLARELGGDAPLVETEAPKKRLVGEDQGASDDEDEEEKRIRFSGVRTKSQRQKIAEEIGAKKMIHLLSVCQSVQHCLF